MSNERREPFGERFGFIAKPPLQYDSLNQATRTALFNDIYWLVFTFPVQAQIAPQFEISKMLSDLKEELWTGVLGQNILDYKDQHIAVYIREAFGRQSQFYEVYQIIEDILRCLPQKYYPLSEIIEVLNSRLIRHSVGWRLNEIGEFVPVSNAVELDAINQILENAEENRLTTIATHLNTAVQMLSNNPGVDQFRLSIKESISMVGVIARKLAGENDLAKALHKLHKKGLVTASLKDKFKNYYSYTSGENGIRHELMEEAHLDFEEAKYFLVACSAFTNYLIEKSVKAKLLP